MSKTMNIQNMIKVNVSSSGFSFKFFISVDSVFIAVLTKKLKSRNNNKGFNMSAFPKYPKKKFWRNAGEISVIQNVFSAALTLKKESQGR